VISHSGNASAPQTREKEITNITITFDGPDDPLNPQNWPVRDLETTFTVTSTNSLRISSGRKSPPTP
jgi:hypothetical protein